MGKTPVRMKAVIYGLSPFQQKVMPGLWKDLPGKIHHKVSENWLSATLLLGPLIGTYRHVFLSLLSRFDGMLYHVAAPDPPSIFYVTAIIRFSENPQSLIQFEHVHLFDYQYPNSYVDIFSFDAVMFSTTRRRRSLNIGTEEDDEDDEFKEFSKGIHVIL
ncbi:hypothetical protein ZIOFF_032545 [Zingiber officinale]|uniref:Uncharacterized protein n=1 Tax=Zingiber officinale TaxID=94328 RepID=A0A8J5GVL3_ZINOF|nr:hypothetical protein ZIOFF_032545 [Zingiber officinale]